MIEEEEFPWGYGVSVPLTGANLIALVARRGYVMCGYLNLEAAEKMGDAAAVVAGVSSIKQALDAPIKAMTSEAKKRGVKEGMTAREALELLQ